MDLLRFATAGSVDDGKSTLIGRLLLDAKAVFEDQLAAVAATSRDRGHDFTDLALLTDGLRAEREQGITIDVAYRYFATPRRTFIVADTPGHVEYTRNMVTGASTADLGLVLVDARQGLTEQSRRHAVLLSLLRVPHVVLAVNKMDLVGWSQETFEQIEAEFAALTGSLGIPDVTVIPLSALHGDNVVTRSEHLAWYSGPALLEHLETVPVDDEGDDRAARFPVQYVIRPQSGDRPDYRGYAGRVAGGVLRPGDEVVVLPSGTVTTIAGIDVFDAEVAEAVAPMSVVVRLTDDVDVARGDLICPVDRRPSVAREVEATVCWLAGEPLHPGRRLAIKHTTRSARAVVTEIVDRLDVNALTSTRSPGGLRLNEIGQVRLRVSAPLLVDAYADNRTTGSFILIDEASGATVGAGLVS